MTFPHLSARARVSLLAACAMLLAWAPAAEAQTAFGLIRGRVVGEDGRAISGATVELALRGRVFRRSLTTSDGEFQFPALPPGEYGVRARQIGYTEPDWVERAVAAGVTVSVTIALELQPLEVEGVEVTAGGLEIQRENVEFSTSIQDQQIALLPSSSDPADLVALTPGARAGHVWGGATAQANNYQLDGTAANHPGVGGDLVQPSVNWIERVEVRGLGAGAEYGNFQGGLVNVVTKSGSNELQGAFRSSVENHRLNASNLVPTEVGSETAARYDLEGEVRGPLVRDRLFYYLAGQWTADERRYVDHLPFEEREFTPANEVRDERKVFGKLTWAPTARHELEGTFGYFDTEVERYGSTGYEVPEATLQLTAPTRIQNLSWRAGWTDWLTMTAKVASIARNEIRAPYAGPDVPATQHYGFSSRLYPPEASYHNAPIHYRHAPESLTGSLQWGLRFRTGEHEHVVTAGAEHSIGRFVDQRTRSGGMTWRPPARPSLDVNDPGTWRGLQEFIPITTGGEVDLHAEVENSAAYVQGSFALGSRLALSPGIRLGRWAGRLLPGGDAGRRFTAVEDQAWEPRLGAMFDITGDNSFVAKAHWGRYHQSMIAQFFDRAEGGEVFTNEELWYYYGAPPATPGTRFTEEERAALVENGDLELVNRVVLNETGPVADYQQPYIDQWLVGLEKTFAGIVRLEAVYVNRRNRNMAALVDRNRESNYTLYERVRVRDINGQPLPFEGGAVQLSGLWAPNNWLSDHLKCYASGACAPGFGAPPPPPGLEYADTLNLTWNPDYVLTNAPGAQRRFDQLQLAVEVSRPTWGASGSWVFTDLEGNLDNVTGYDEQSGYGAGPYVRVNEGVNSFGKLPNFSDKEMKAAVWGDLPWGLNGGLFWTKSSGDYYSPVFTLSANGQYLYYTERGEQIFHSYLRDMEGHQVFIGPRGGMQLRQRVRFDLHLEREFRVGGAGWTMSLDLFNALNYGTVTEVNPSVNYGRNYYHFLPGGGTGSMFGRPDPNQYFKAVLDRVPPRTLRIGTVVRF